MLLIICIIILLLFGLLVLCWRDPGVKVHLIEDWRGVWGLLSTKAAVLLSASTTTIAAFSDSLSKAWEGLPGGLRDALPDHARQWIAGVALFAAFMAVFLAARLTKQPVTRPEDQKP